jgi:hypothetical protein
MPFFRRDLIRHALSDVEIARVYANREFFDNFEKVVEDDAKWAYTFQRDFDKRLKVRDDICWASNSFRFLRAWILQRRQASFRIAAGPVGNGSGQSVQRVIARFLLFS